MQTHIYTYVFNVHTCVCVCVCVCVCNAEALASLSRGSICTPQARHIFVECSGINAFVLFSFCCRFALVLLMLFTGSFGETRVLNPANTGLVPHEYPKVQGSFDTASWDDLALVSGWVLIR